MSDIFVGVSIVAFAVVYILLILWDIFTYKKEEKKDVK